MSWTLLFWRRLPGVAGHSLLGAFCGVLLAAFVLAGALCQLDRVAAARKTKADEATVRKAIEGLLDEKKEARMGGQAGVPLVNLADRMKYLAPAME